MTNPEAAGLTHTCSGLPRSSLYCKLRSSAQHTESPKPTGLCWRHHRQLQFGFIIPPTIIGRSFSHQMAHLSLYAHLSLALTLLTIHTYFKCNLLTATPLCPLHLLIPPTLTSIHECNIFADLYILFSHTHTYIYSYCIYTNNSTPRYNFFKSINALFYCGISYPKDVSKLLHK